MPETCETCNGYETVMRQFDDGGASLGRESIPCPTCCPAPEAEPEGAGAIAAAAEAARGDAP